MKKIALFALLLLVFPVAAWATKPLPQHALAQQAQPDPEQARQFTSTSARAIDQYVLSAQETNYGNLYVGAGDARVAGEVQGDLFIGGGNVIITGSVTDDIFIVGGNIDLRGQAGEDVRIAGGQVSIDSNIKGDLIAFGGVVDILPGAVINGDVIVGGGLVNVDGLVNGYVNAFSGEMNINGEIAGNVDLNVSDKFKIGKSGNVHGDVTYVAADDIIFENLGIIGGQIVFKPRHLPGFLPDRDESEILFGIISFFILIKLLAMLLVAILAVTFLGRLSKDVVNESINNFGGNLLKGLIAFIVFPVVIITLFVSLVGSVLGMATALLYGAFMLIANVFAGILFGALLYKWLSKSKKAVVSRQSAAIGVILLAAVRFIPLLGGLAVAVFMLVSFGAALNLLYQAAWRNR